MSAQRAHRAWAYENPRPEVQALVPRDARRILDLGCSSGVVGAALKSRQDVEVVGVEVDRELATDARLRLDRVVEADVEHLLAAGDLGTELGRFDCLIAADVLEHLRDPWTALRRTAGLLDAGDTAVVSLPNVRYWETFWALGRRGTWPRRHEGIFDETHLRWFALSDALALVEQANLDATEVRPQYRLRPQGSQWDEHAAWLGRTRLRGFFAFQYVLAARRR